MQKSADSLADALSRRKSQFDKTLYKSRFFKFERKNANSKDSSWSHRDSLRRQVRPQKLVTVENFDKIYDSMDAQEKDIVLKAALENAEAVKKYVESNKVDLYERRKNIHKHDIAWHEKFTLSFACLIFFFIGAPLGAIIRKGGFGLPFIVSIIFFIAYYVISVMGRKFVEEGIMLPWQGMWLSSMLTLPLGVLFTLKATSDSVLFDPGAYIEIIKRPFKVLEIQFKDPSVVFHKDVEIPDNSIILEKMAEIETKAKKLTSNLDGMLKSIMLSYVQHFKKDRSELMNYIDDYNTLFNILSVKYRDKIFFKANLEKFPKIDKERYEMTKMKLRANYFILTIGLFPVGLLVLLNSYFKVRVLKQKINMVSEQLKTIQSML